MPLIRRGFSLLLAVYIANLLLGHPSQTFGLCPTSSGPLAGASTRLVPNRKTHSFPEQRIYSLNRCPSVEDVVASVFY